LGLDVSADKMRHWSRPNALEKSSIFSENKMLKVATRKMAFPVGAFEKRRITFMDDIAKSPADRSRI
jgi:hypothetical protein